MPFLIFNATDQIFATPDTFPSLRAAVAGVAALRARFSAIEASQGHYRTAGGDQVPAAFVELEVWKSSDFYGARKGTVWNDNYDSPMESLIAMLCAERFLGAAWHKDRLVLKKGSGLPKGYTLSVHPWLRSEASLSFQLSGPGGVPVSGDHPSLAPVAFPDEAAGWERHVEAFRLAVPGKLQGIVELALAHQVAESEGHRG